MSSNLKEHDAKVREPLVDTLVRVEKFWETGGSRSQYEALRKVVAATLAKVKEQ